MEYLKKHFNNLNDANDFIYKNKLNDYKLQSVYNPETMQTIFILEYKENNND